MAENLTIGGDQPVMLQSYQSKDGKPLNMWLGNEGGENYKVAEEIYLSPNQIAAMRAKSKMAITKEGNTVARSAAPDCETYNIDTYENNFYYANAYDESIGNVTVQRIHRTITMTVCHPGNDFNSDYYLPVTGSEGGGTVSYDLSPDNMNFKMSQEDINKYKKFAKLVKGIYDFAIKDKKTLDCLKTYSHMTDEQIYKILQFDKGPRIVIKDINTNTYWGNKYGYFKASEDKNVINIDIKTVMQYENQQGKVNEAAMVFFLSTVLLHESVHYGNSLNSFSEGKYDFGGGWEICVYGMRIDSPEGAQIYTQRQ
jgi:hypothetical protein